MQQFFFTFLILFLFLPNSALAQESSLKSWFQKVTQAYVKSIEDVTIYSFLPPTLEIGLDHEDDAQDVKRIFTPGEKYRPDTVAVMGYLKIKNGQGPNKSEEIIPVKLQRFGYLGMQSEVPKLIVTSPDGYFSFRLRLPHKWNPQSLETKNEILNALLWKGMMTTPTPSFFPLRVTFSNGRFGGVELEALAFEDLREFFQSLPNAKALFLQEDINVDDLVTLEMNDINFKNYFLLHFFKTLVGIEDLEIGGYFSQEKHYLVRASNVAIISLNDEISSSSALYIPYDTEIGGALSQEQRPLYSNFSPTYSFIPHADYINLWLKQNIHTDIDKKRSQKIAKDLEKITLIVQQHVEAHPFLNALEKSKIILNYKACVNAFKNFF